MIETRKSGDIFTCGAHAIVNTVNCVGVMGKGIALEYKTRYPAMFMEYAKLCHRDRIQTGKMWLWHEVPVCRCGHVYESHSGHTFMCDEFKRPLGPIPDFCACCTGDRACAHWSPVNEYIVNFPTKQHWRNPSQMEWIASGLDDLRSYVTMGMFKSLAMPALGCSNGGLKFVDVQALIYDKLQELDIPIILFEPQ